MAKPFLFAVALAVAVLSGCASHRVAFQTWDGIPADEAAELKRGEFRAGAEQVLDALATTLEHEPYLHWSIDSLDKKNGFITANAGLLREIQLRVVADASGSSRTRVSVSIPRRELKVRAKIWVKDSSGFQTPYEPAEAEKGDYHVQIADALLDADYVRSFAWRVLNDKSQVPFRIVDAGQAEAEPVPINEAPAK